jgi:mono/diheme cytochrome c family protein
MSRFLGRTRSLRWAGWGGALGLLGAALIPVVQAAPQGPPAAAVEPLPATIEFNRDIRPILADKCFQCHGPGTQLAAIRFDLEDGAKHALSGGRFAIVAGDPANSEVIKRIIATNPAIRMPRSQGGAAAGDPLTARQIALLTRWVEQGAKWQKHWSFILPTRPEVPKGL